MSRKKQPKTYYDPSGNKVIRETLSRKEKNTIFENKNLYLQKAKANDFSYITDENASTLRNYYNKEYMKKCVELLNKYQCTPPIDYIKTHVMYLFYLDRVFEGDAMVAKVGYSNTLYKRSEGISKRYQCGMILLSVRLVNCEEDERSFHNYIERMSEKHIYYYSENNNEKYELYYLDEYIIHAFFNYDIILKNQLAFEEEKTKQIVEIEKAKQVVEIERTKQEEERTKQEEERTKQEEERTKQVAIQEEERTKQEQERTKQMEIELKLVKLKNKIKI